MITPFKNRSIDYSKPVEMYRCLNRKGFVFSLRQSGKVVGHTEKIILKDCELVVNEAGKNRCLTSNIRNVHAFVKGYITDDVLLSFSFILRYLPFEDKGFHYKIHDELVYIDKADRVYLQEGKIYCQV